MTRRTTFLFGLSGIAGCRRDRRPRLNVFNWSAYVAEDTIANFEREFGVRVRYGVYESNEEMLARVMTGNSGWDVVFPTHYYLEPMRRMGLLAPLDRDRLPNIRNLDSAFQHPVWDRSHDWCVPYMWAGTGIIYNRKLAPPPARWSDLWNARLRGRITMLDDPVDVLSACLKKLGLSTNTQNPADLRAAQAEAVKQKPLLRAYLNAEVRDQLVPGDVLAAQLWSTTAQQAIDAAPESLAFVFPLEGYALYADNAVILRESQRTELAHRFLDYLLRPKVAADIVAYARTACANGAARTLLAAEVRDNPTLFPAPHVLARGEWGITPEPEIQRLRDRLWTEIKSS